MTETLGWHTQNVTLLSLTRKGIKHENHTLYERRSSDRTVRGLCACPAEDQRCRANEGYMRFETEKRDAKENMLMSEIHALYDGTGRNKIVPHDQNECESDDKEPGALRL